jgi:hypothetical protein
MSWSGGRVSKRLIEAGDSTDGPAVNNPADPRTEARKGQASGKLSYLRNETCSRHEEFDELNTQQLSGNFIVGRI